MIPCTSVLAWHFHIFYLCSWLTKFSFEICKHSAEIDNVFGWDFILLECSVEKIINASVFLLDKEYNYLRHWVFFILSSFAYRIMNSSCISDKYVISYCTININLKMFLFLQLQRDQFLYGSLVLTVHMSLLLYLRTQMLSHSLNKNPSHLKWFP